MFYQYIFLLGHEIQKENKNIEDINKLNDNQDNQPIELPVIQPYQKVDIKNLYSLYNYIFHIIVFSILGTFIIFQYNKSSKFKQIVKHLPLIFNITFVLFLLNDLYNVFTYCKIFVLVLIFRYCFLILVNPKIKRIFTKSEEFKTLSEKQRNIVMAQIKTPKYLEYFLLNSFIWGRIFQYCNNAIQVVLCCIVLNIIVTLLSLLINYWCQLYLVSPKNQTGIFNAYNALEAKQKHLDLAKL